MNTSGIDASGISTTGENAPAKPPQGNTLPAQGERQERVPRTPNERDESADSQNPAEASQEHVGRAAHGSIARGEVDTGKAPAMDATYDRLREGARQPEKQKRL